MRCYLVPPDNGRARMVGLAAVSVRPVAPAGGGPPAAALGHPRIDSVRGLPCIIFYMCVNNSGINRSSLISESD